MSNCTTNPFLRGFDHATPLWARRDLVISPADGCYEWRPTDADKHHSAYYTWR